MRTTPAIRRALPRLALKASLYAVLARLLFAYRVYRERRALMALSDRQLQDIGLSRSQAYREASRRFLDLPH